MVNLPCTQFPITSLAVGGISIFLVYLLNYQDRLLYMPSAIGNRKTSLNKPPYQNPSLFGLKYEDIWLKTPDNLKLHSWWIPYLTKKQCKEKPDECNAIPTILFFHANAGNMGHRLPNIKQMNEKLNCNIFIISYRGYGDSDGDFPTENGMKLDGKTAYNYLKNEKQLNNIYIFGRSLGGAVAINTVHEIQNDKQFSGLILENTFKSIDDMVGSVFPFLNFRIIKDNILWLNWNSYKLMKNINCKVLFFASTNDEIVPHQHMLDLYEICPSKNKELIKIMRGQHNNAVHIGGNRYWKPFRKFVE